MRTASDVSVGDDLQRISSVATEERIKAYADASGDQNPLHQNEDAARAAGFDRIVAHGMFTMALAATCVTKWAGDVSALRHMHAHFRAPVFAGETMTAAGRVVEKQDGGRIVLDLWVEVERGGAVEYPMRKSRATVVLPSAGPA